MARLVFRAKAAKLVVGCMHTILDAASERATQVYSGDVNRPKRDSRMIRHQNPGQAWYHNGCFDLRSSALSVIQLSTRFDPPHDEAVGALPFHSLQNNWVYVLVTLPKHGTPRVRPSRICVFANFFFQLHFLFRFAANSTYPFCAV